MNFRSRKIDRKRFLGFQLCFSPLQNTSTIWKICFPWTQVGGESACPQQSGARAGAAFFRQDSREALSLHSAFLSKSSKILYTYPFSLFFSCLVSIEMQASQKKKAGMHSAHRQHVLFLESVELWTCPEMSAWTGPERQGKDPDGRCKTQLSSRTSHSDRLQSTCLS